MLTLYSPTPCDQRGAALPHLHLFLHHYTHTGESLSLGELNPKITPQVKEAFKKKFHLDRPLHEQYWLNMRDLFSGQLRSIKDDRPVLSRIAERLPATVSLNVLAIALSLTFGLLLGVYAAKHAGKLPDVLTSILAFVFIALPASGFRPDRDWPRQIYKRLRFSELKPTVSISQTPSRCGWTASGTSHCPRWCFQSEASRPSRATSAPA